MSSFDPLAGIIADAALAQSSVAAIDLGVQIEILQQQLAVGDLITATILPPQNGIDLLSFLGQTVQAQLPPGLDPGQTLLLQVTGFQGNQILVRNIGLVDPENPPPTVTVTLPQPEPGAPTQATLYTVAPQTQQAAPADPTVIANSSNGVTLSLSKASTQQQPAPLAPSRAVFVAASVQKVQPAPPQSPQTAAAQKLGPIVVPPENELALEARIAATRAASIDIEELVNQPTPTKPAAAQTAPAQAAPPPLRAAPPPPASTPIPAITPRAPTPAPAIAPELALLARLRIPALPFTLAAARLANTAASALPKALARLDALLEHLPQPDARAATVRTIAAFLDKIDLGNTRALPEQLMAYINNVVDGAESKLAALVRNLNAAQDDPPAPAADNGQSASPNTPAQSPNITLSLSKGATQATSPDTQAANPASAQPAVAAHAAERAVALQYDLKTAIAALSDSPPHGASPQLAGALNDALTTITAAQLNVANGQTTDPNTLVIPLPVFYYEGGRPAQLRISRDASEGARKLDSDNFHIAFVLDTKSLGTVAVDVQTASRSVSVNVKTEVAAAAARFRDTFDDLRGRLELLRYRVANIAANVAPPSNVALSTAPEAREVEGQPKSSSRLDLQA